MTSALDAEMIGANSSELESNSTGDADAAAASANPMMPFMLGAAMQGDHRR